MKQDLSGMDKSSDAFRESLNSFIDVILNVYDQEQFNGMDRFLGVGRGEGENKHATHVKAVTLEGTPRILINLEEFRKKGFADPSIENFVRIIKKRLPISFDLFYNWKAHQYDCIRLQRERVKSEDIEDIQYNVSWSEVMKILEKLKTSSNRNIDKSEHNSPYSVRLSENQRAADKPQATVYGSNSKLELRGNRALLAHHLYQLSGSTKTYSATELSTSLGSIEPKEVKQIAKGINNQSLKSLRKNIISIDASSKPTQYRWIL